MSSIKLDPIIQALSGSHDFMNKVISSDTFSARLLYFSTLCDEKILQDNIILPALECRQEADLDRILQFNPACSIVEELKKVENHLLSGSALVVLQDKIYAFKASLVANDTARSAETEQTIQGPVWAYTENMQTNIQLIRRRYPSVDLIIEQTSIGKVSGTKLSIIYDRKKVRKPVLEELRHRLDQIDVDVLIAAGQLEKLLTPTLHKAFPTLMLTERPDRTILNLSQGKVVLLIEGTPFALIAPAVFYDFMSAMDDIYQTYWVSRALVILRYVGLFLSTTLPAMYVAIVSYNPEMFKVQFALSIAGSRMQVPYPSFIEVFIMLFLIEALVEASVRLPKYIGSTATTVGGLILGQAAQQAGLVSSIMIIIASAVAISNFVVPINMMSFSMRLVKYPLVILAMFFGIFGVILGVFCLLMYMCNLQSFGEPFLKLFVSEAAKTGHKGELR